MRDLIITIDNVLRGTTEKLDIAYQVAYPNGGDDLDHKVKLFSKEYCFEDAESAKDFLYADFTLEIFGHAKEHYKQASVDFNTLQNSLLGEVNIELFCQGVGRQVPATYFFLSKIACQARKVNILPSLDEIVDYQDIVVGAHYDPSDLIQAGKRVFVLGAEDKSNPDAFYIDKLSDLNIHYLGQ